MSNPLAIPDIIGKVFEHFSIRELATISHVNKTWRLEARRIIYKNRSAILYGFFEPYLNELRLRNLGISANLLSVIPFQEFERSRIFRIAFDLDYKAELLSIRDRFKAIHKKSKKKCKRLDKIFLKKAGLVNSYIHYSKEYDDAKSDCAKAFDELRTSERHRFRLYKTLVNYEYFLVRFAGPSLLTDKEIDVIINKLEPIREADEEMRWQEQASSIFEYWGDEDPDMV